MSLIIINDGLHKDYNELFDKVMELKPSFLDVYLNGGVETVEQLSGILNHLYDILRSISNKNGFDYKFQIDVLFNPPDYSRYTTVFTAVEESVESVVTKKIQCDTPSQSYPIKKESIGAFEVVAVGGTFDHIHDGHKILLSTALFLTKKKLIVGITDDELLKNKKYRQCLQSFEERLKITTEFLQKISKDQTFDLYKIIDVCGPTGYIKDIDCLVLSKESASGGDYVNNYRKSIGYPTLEVFEIELVGGEDKLSSTDLRRLEFEEREEREKKEKKERK